ncbi:hypothetical protein yrohd0001_4760 [Yersinia rohdei ATCC 43380]|nr:hypothetical protein yrohd0001_4760 [Yersinia rohdei ATCC 43380]
MLAQKIAKKHNNPHFVYHAKQSKIPSLIKQIKSLNKLIFKFFVPL